MTAPFVAFSIAAQWAAGTLSRALHMLGALGATPIAAANAARPPACSAARSMGVMVGACVNHERDCASITNVFQASCQITGVKTIADRLKAAREAAHLKQDELAMKAGVSQGTIGNIESGLRKRPRELIAIAEAVGVNPKWLETGKPPRSLDSQPPANERPKMGAPQMRGGSDQPMSHSTVNMGLQQVTWEQILAGDELEEIFMTQVPDESCAPRFPKGHWIIWRKSAMPTADELVLVRDAHNLLHAMTYTMGKEPGAWSAVPIRRSYPTYDCTEVTIVGVYWGDMKQ